MKPIDKKELFGNLSEFLKTKGIDLQEGAYTRRIQQGCSILADTINLSQQAVTRAKTEVDTGLERMRQVIHDKTAPKPPAEPAAPTPVEPSAEPVPPQAKAKKPAGKRSRKPQAKARAGK